MAKIQCYIEEYKAKNGLGARLRDKRTGKKVIIKASEELKMQLRELLGAAKTYKNIIPSVFDRKGYNIVAIYGKKRKENKAEILIDIAREDGFLFGYAPEFDDFKDID